MKVNLQLLNGKISYLGLVALLLVVLPVHAQNTSLSLAHDPSGRVSLFYSDEWTFAPTPNGFTLTQEDIDLQLDVLETADNVDLAEWLLSEVDLPSDTFIMPSEYAGLEGWIVQGVDLLETGRFSAALALPLDEDETILIRVTSPAESLSEDAATLTTMFDQMLALPQPITTPEMTFSLPLDWQTESIEGVTWATGDEITLSLSFTNEVQLPARTQQQVLDFTINGEQVHLQFQQDPAGQGELYLTRTRDGKPTLFLQAFADDPSQLANNLYLLQAIFASANEM